MLARHQRYATLPATLFLVGALTTLQVSAEETFIAGLGAQSCSFLTAAIQPGDGWAANTLTKSVMSWAQGFMSGTNAVMREYRKKYFDLGTLNRDEQWVYLFDFCRSNPTQDFSHAVYDMMFNRLRIREVPPTGERK